MDEMLADILETCLIRIDAGASIDECLAAYPQQRDALEAPLRAATQIRALPQPALPAAARATLETKMLALAGQRRMSLLPSASSNGHRPHAVPGSGIRPAALLAGLLRALGYRGPLALPWLRLAAAAIALILALALGTGALAAARAIIRAVQGSPSTPTTTLPAAMPFVLDGPIEQIGSERWVVNGMAINLDAQTTITGTPELGVIAHVRGNVQADATLIAHSIIVDAPQPSSTSAPIAPTSPAPVVIPAATPVQVPNGESGKPPKPDKPDKPDNSDKPEEPPKPDKPGKGKGKD
jgi:hypothetical protein